MTLFGTILLVFPFFLIFYFKNKKEGFITILVANTLLHLVISILAQFFHFFHYPIILSLVLLTNLAIAYWAIKNKNKANFKIKFNIFAFLAALIILFELFSVHYFFTGEVSTIKGNKDVANVFYPYPYSPDDWAGVAFTTYAINNNNLPTTNPLIDGPDHYNFRNIFVGFFALLAQIFLIINIQPIFGFPILAVYSGFLVCFLVYLFLKSAKVKEFPALIAALSLPWVINSSKLPGIWYLFPFIGGTIFFLAALIALNLKKNKLAIVSSLLSILLYPPLIMFIAPALLVYFLSDKNLNWKNFLKIILSTLLGIIVIAALIFLVQVDNAKDLVNLFFESLIRPNNEGGISSREIWRVIPVILLPLAFFGLSVIKKKKLWYFATPLAIGLVYWLVYSFSPKFLVIDYARTAVITAYLIIITAGFGIDELSKQILKKYEFSESTSLMIKNLIIFLFALIAIFYTRYGAWKHIKLTYETALGEVVAPFDAPANHYLHPDDLRIFQNIKNTRFLSQPWKGLVIGVATNNYPMHAKGATITNFYHPYYFFSDGNCDYKKSVAEDMNIKYVYLPKFNCPNFIFLDKSSEDIYLYKFQP
ncbi:hypothetical protein GW758_00385 [Candidatus Falkowbacteria bacterium]|nr:hypothetical protein [Candidatus Falkowbacteria bacterium]